MKLTYNLVVAEYRWTGMIAHGGNDNCYGIRAGFCKCNFHRKHMNYLHAKRGTV